MYIAIPLWIELVSDRLQLLINKRMTCVNVTCSTSIVFGRSNSATFYIMYNAILIVPMHTQVHDILTVLYMCAFCCSMLPCLCLT